MSARQCFDEAGHLIPPERERLFTSVAERDRVACHLQRQAREARERLQLRQDHGCAAWTIAEAQQEAAAAYQAARAVRDLPVVELANPRHRHSTGAVIRQPIPLEDAIVGLVDQVLHRLLPAVANWRGHRSPAVATWLEGVHHSTAVLATTPGREVLAIGEDSTNAARQLAALMEGISRYLLNDGDEYSVFATNEEIFQRRERTRPVEIEFARLHQRLDDLMVRP